MKSKARLFRLLEDKGFPRSDTENAATGEGETKNGEKENRSVHNGVRKKLAISRWFAFWMDSPVRRFQNTWLYDINVCGRINPNELTRVDGIGFDLRTLHRARVCNRIIERSYEIVARYK